MYRSRPSPRDRAAALALVVAIHVALGFALINLSGNVREALPQDVVEMFDVIVPLPPPPPVVEKLPEPEQAKPKEDEGAASAKNIKSRATPVVAPKPPIVLPIVQPIPATTTPNTGSDSTQGASTPGTGTGAGGQGTGTGSGGSGSGSGGGGIGRPPRLLQGNITRRDYPAELKGSRVPREELEMEFKIGTDGRARDCRAVRSSGSAILDAATCRLGEERYVYSPALDKAGKPTTIIGRMRRMWWLDR